MYYKLRKILKCCSATAERQSVGAQRLCSRGVVETHRNLLNFQEWKRNRLEWKKEIFFDAQRVKRKNITASGPAGRARGEGVVRGEGAKLLVTRRQI